MRHLFIIFILAFLAACTPDSIIKTEPEPIRVEPTEPAEPATTTADEDVQILFSQKYIDPLTDWLAKNEKDKKLATEISRVTAEREKRCANIAKRYQRRDKTPAMLDKLKRGYLKSCPQVVANFAEQVKQEQPKKQTCESAFTEQDYSQSLALCKPLAQQGDDEAQLILGKLYLNGKGVTANQDEAYVWFGLATFAENTEAIALRDKIDAKLNQDTRLKLQERMLKISEKYGQ